MAWCRQAPSHYLKHGWLPIYDNVSNFQSIYSWCGTHEENIVLCGKGPHNQTGSAKRGQKLWSWKIPWQSPHLYFDLDHMACPTNLLTWQLKLVNNLLTWQLKLVNKLVTWQLKLVNKLNRKQIIPETLVCMKIVSSPVTGNHDLPQCVFWCIYQFPGLLLTHYGILTLDEIIRIGSSLVQLMTCSFINFNPEPEATCSHEISMIK